MESEAQDDVAEIGPKAKRAALARAQPADARGGCLPPVGTRDITLRAPCPGLVSEGWGTWTDWSKSRRQLQGYAGG